MSETVKHPTLPVKTLPQIFKITEAELETYAKEYRRWVDKDGRLEVKHSSKDDERAYAGSSDADEEKNDQNDKVFK